jgi:hypothetical protein
VNFTKHVVSSGHVSMIGELFMYLLRRKLVWHDTHLSREEGGET